jgi:hypothetical protein
MSLKDVVEGVVGATTTDPQAARGAMLDKLHHARQAYAGGGHDQLGGGWITAGEADRIAFAPTRPDGQQVVIGGQAVTFWQASELPAVLDAFEAAINAGELDPQLMGSTPAGHSLPLARLTPTTSS